MNRTIKDATVRRYHYTDHRQLTAHLELFLAAYNYAGRLKTLKGLTPHEYVCRIWTEEPERFKLIPYHHTPELKTSTTWIAIGSRSPPSRVWIVAEPPTRPAIPNAHHGHGAHQPRSPCSTQVAVGVAENGCITQGSPPYGSITTPCVSARVASASSSVRGEIPSADATSDRGGMRPVSIKGLMKP